MLLLFRRNELQLPFWRQSHSLLSSCSSFSLNKGQLKFLPSSTPRIELVFGKFKDSPPRLGCEFIDTRFLLVTEASSSKLLPISGSAAQRTGCERHTTEQSRLGLNPLHFPGSWPLLPALGVILHLEYHFPI